MGHERFQSTLLTSASSAAGQWEGCPGVIDRGGMEREKWPSISLVEVCGVGMYACVRAYMLHARVCRGFECCSLLIQHSAFVSCTSLTNGVHPAFLPRRGWNMLTGRPRRACHSKQAETSSQHSAWPKDLQWLQKEVGCVGTPRLKSLTSHIDRRLAVACATAPPTTRIYGGVRSRGCLHDGECGKLFCSAVVVAWPAVANPPLVCLRAGLLVVSSPL